MTKFYKFFAAVAFLICSIGSFAQSNIVSQSFEGSGTWNYSEFPDPYTVYTSASDRWGICGTTPSSNGDTVGSQPIIVFNNGDVVAPFLGVFLQPQKVITIMDYRTLIIHILVP